MTPILLLQLFVIVHTVGTPFALEMSAVAPTMTAIVPTASSVAPSDVTGIAPTVVSYCSYGYGCYCSYSCLLLFIQL